MFARSETRCICNVIFLTERSSWRRSGCAPRQQHHPYARPPRSGSRRPARAVRRRLVRRDLRWACWLSASVIEVSSRTQGPRVDLRRLEDDVPEVAEARPRAISTVLATNKYRSRDEQVPFSRRTSTVLTSNKYRSREGGRGRTRGGRRGAVRGTVKGRCQRCGQRPCQGARSKVQSGGAVRGA